MLKNGHALGFLVLQPHAGSSAEMHLPTAAYKMEPINSRHELMGMAGFCFLTQASVQRG